MSKHEVTARTDRLIAILSGAAVLALLAYGQHQDAKDDVAARAHVQQQARGDAK
jgi:hypothetical protein